MPHHMDVEIVSLEMGVIDAVFGLLMESGAGIDGNLVDMGFLRMQGSREKDTGRQHRSGRQRVSIQSYHHVFSYTQMYENIEEKESAAAIFLSFT